MTKPSLTVGHGDLNDCHTTTGFTKTDNGNTSTFTIDSGDFFKLDVTVSGGAEETKVVNDVNLGLSTSHYTKIHWAYKCSNVNVKAKIIAEFNDASTQEVLADVGTITWTKGSTTLTTAKTLDHIRLYADHAVGTVYYDFTLVCEGVFTFPFVSGSEELELENNYVYLKIPGRVGNITQYLGMDSPLIRLSGKMNTDTGWRGSGAQDYGYSLTDIFLDSHKEPWQWLASDLINCKVTMPRLKISKIPGSKAQRLWTVEMRLYSLSSGDADVWDWISWLGIT